MFAKMIRVIEVAARDGGGNVESNPTLADAIQRARSVSMPNDTIDRAVKRGTGDLEGVKYESLVYEGYGPGGVALLLEVLTDNRNRAAADIRRIFTKNGGTMGDPGSVAWMFNRKGVMLVPAGKVSEDDLLLVGMEAGAEDVVRDGDHWRVTCEVSEFQELKKALNDAGMEPESAQLSMEPAATMPLDRSDAEKVMKLMDDLDDNDDVQEVYTNFDIPDELLAEAGSG